MAGLTNKEKEALALFKERLLAAFPDRVADIKLFGSKARGEASKFSDVDVLVVLKEGTWRDHWPIHQIAATIFWETDVDLSVKILTDNAARHLRSVGSPLLMNIDREGVVI